MHVVTVLAKKGGVGKTTLSLNFGIAAELNKKRVAVLDMDIQQSTAAWSSKYRDIDGPVFTPSEAGDLQRQLQVLRDHRIDIVFIDTPPESPRNSAPVSAAVEAASLLVVPFTPQVLAVEATYETSNALRGMAKESLIVINLGPLPEHKRAVDDIHMAAQSYGLPICPHIIARRNDFEVAERLGLGVLEHNPKGKAAQELTAVYTYIINTVKKTTCNKVTL